MQKLKYIIVFLIIIISTLWIHYNHEDQLHRSHAPHKILYYEGGPYYDYVATLKSLFKGLQQIGLIESIEIPDFPKKEDSRELWNFLCNNVKSEHISLSKEDYYSSDWNRELRKKNKEHVINKLKDPESNVSVVIAMGTWAGLDLGTGLQPVNTMVLSTTEPVDSGILRDKDDKRFENVFVEYTPDVYYQQINIFHTIFQFKKLGIFYVDSPDGRTYAAYDDVHRVAEEKDFNVVTCIVDAPYDSIDLLKQSKECIDFLSGFCDAMYFGDQYALKYEYLPYMISSTLKNKIPTWTHHGIEHVRRGILMSKSYEAGFEAKGLWNAKVLERIIHGRQPNTINRIWKDETELVINSEVAKIIGWDIPESLLKISREIIPEIERSNVDVEGLLNNGKKSEE